MADHFAQTDLRKSRTPAVPMCIASPLVDPFWGRQGGFFVDSGSRMPNVPIFVIVCVKKRYSAILQLLASCVYNHFYLLINIRNSNMLKKINWVSVCNKILRFL
jgi:hypothetical protein